MRQAQTRQKIVLVLFGATVGLAGCATPSARISSALERYGLNATQAQCVGDRLETNLSLGQLQQLGRAARAVNQGDSTPGQLTPDDLLRVSSQIDDLKVPIEVAKASAGCGLITRMIGQP